MSLSRKKVNPLNIALFLIGVAVSLFATYKTIYYGCDIDESYAITLSYRLVMGDHLFKEMWEVHQSSAIFMAPFIWIYRHVAGNTIGMVVYLRAVGCVIQFLMSLALFHSLSKHISKSASGMLALIFYNFTPKYLNVPEFCFLQYLFMTALLICVLYYMHTPKKLWLFGMGMSLAGTVLAYPQTVLFVPVQYFLLWLLIRKGEGKDRSGKKLLWIFAGEAICGVVFLGYVLAFVSPVELVNNIPMILADQSHSMNMAEKIASLLWELLGKCSWLIPLVIVYEAACFWFRKARKKEPVYAPEILLFVIWIFWIVPFWLYDERPGVCHLDTFYLIFAEFAGIGYLNLRTKKTNESAIILRLASMVLLCMVAVVSVSSNLSFYANGGMLVPVIFLIWTEFLMNRTVKEEGVTDEEASVMGKKRAAALVLLASACLCFLLARCILIRFTALQQHTIFSQLHPIAVGTAKGISVTEQEHIQYHSKMATLQKYVGVEDSVFYMGSDLYLYFLIGNQIAVPTSISTPIFDQSVVEYYERYPYKMPDIIFVDKYYVDLDTAEFDADFEAWLSENYDLAHIIDEDAAQIIYRK